MQKQGELMQKQEKLDQKTAECAIQYQVNKQDTHAHSRTYYPHNHHHFVIARTTLLNPLINSPNPLGWNDP